MAAGLQRWMRRGRQKHAPLGEKRPWASIALFLGPAVLIYCIFTLYPVSMTFFNSVHKLDMTQAMARTFVGLKNYQELLTTDLVLKHALRNSITWAFVAPIFDVGLGFFFALILYYRPPFARFFRVAWFVPILISWVVVGVLFRWIYNYDWGPVVVAFRAVGLDALALNYLGTVIRVDPASWKRLLPALLFIPALWLIWRGFQRRNRISLAGGLVLSGVAILMLRFPAGVINIPLYSLIAVTTWKFIGFNMVIFLAAMSSMPEELMDAAKIDGANNFRLLIHIIVPLLRAVIVNLFILSWIGKMVQFALVWVTTRGGPIHYTETIATYVQKRAFEWRTLDLGYPSALAVLWFLVVFVGALLFTRMFSTDETIEY